MTVRRKIRNKSLSNAKNLSTLDKDAFIKCLDMAARKDIKESIKITDFDFYSSRLLTTLWTRTKEHLVNVTFDNDYTAHHISEELLKSSEYIRFKKAVGLVYPDYLLLDTAIAPSIDSTVYLIQNRNELVGLFIFLALTYTPTLIKKIAQDTGNINLPLTMPFLKTYFECLSAKYALGGIVGASEVANFKQSINLVLAQKAVYNTTYLVTVLNTLANICKYLLTIYIANDFFGADNSFELDNVTVEPISLGNEHYKVDDSDALSIVEALTSLDILVDNLKFSTVLKDVFCSWDLAAESSDTVVIQKIIGDKYYNATEMLLQKVGSNDMRDMSTVKNLLAGINTAS